MLQYLEQNIYMFCNMFFVTTFPGMKGWKKGNFCIQVLPRGSEGVCKTSAGMGVDGKWCKNKTTKPDRAHQYDRIDFL